MKKLAFIIPYFGKFNNYFQLFLNSCAKNLDVDWLIYTDDEADYKYPENVKVKYTTFVKIKKLFEEKLNSSIKLERPYKLCDYKPLYGYLFESDLKEYEYWGHCDTDMIWGNIEKMVFPLLDKEYDKLFFLGHCSIYKQSQKYLKFIEKNIKDMKGRIGEVYSSEKNNSFDEEFNNSINSLLIEEGFNLYLREMEANIYMKSSNFNLVKYNFDEEKYEVIKRKNSIFIYEDRSVFQYYLDNEKLKKEEFLYIHMQSRKMKAEIPDDLGCYKIIPNSFEEVEHRNIDEKTLKKIKKKNFNLHYFKLRAKNLRIKILNKFREIL